MLCLTVHTFIKNLEVKIRGLASQHLQLGHQLHVQDTWNSKRLKVSVCSKLLCTTSVVSRTHGKAIIGMAEWGHKKHVLNKLQLLHI